MGEREIEGVVNRAAAVGRTGIKNFPQSMDRQLPNLLLRPIFRNRLGGLQKNNLPLASCNLGEFFMSLLSFTGCGRWDSFSKHRNFTECII